MQPIRFRKVTSYKTPMNPHSFNYMKSNSDEFSQNSNEFARKMFLKMFLKITHFIHFHKTQMNLPCTETSTPPGITQTKPQKKKPKLFKVKKQEKLADQYQAKVFKIINK